MAAEASPVPSADGPPPCARGEPRHEAKPAGSPGPVLDLLAVAKKKPGDRQDCVVAIGNCCDDLLRLLTEAAQRTGCGLVGVGLVAARSDDKVQMQMQSARDAVEAACLADRVLLQSGLAGLDSANPSADLAPVIRSASILVVVGSDRLASVAARAQRLLNEEDAHLAPLLRKVVLVDSGTGPALYERRQALVTGGCADDPGFEYSRRRAQLLSRTNDETAELFCDHFLESEADPSDPAWLCPYVPCAPGRIERMVRYMQLCAEDHVVDIGSGDGRILTEAAALAGCRCTGYEIDSTLVDAASSTARARGLDSLCTFVCGDAVALLTKEIEAGGDVVQAVSVVALYLIPPALRAVRDVVYKLWSKGGVRIVTFVYHFEAWSYTDADPAFQLWSIAPK